MKNEIIFAPREKPLEFHEFEKLDSLAVKNLSFKPRYFSQLVWETDEYGEKIQRKISSSASPEIFSKGEIDQRLLDSLCRPSPVKSVIVHLSRLAAHKPWGRGHEGWVIVLEDFCRDIAGISEYAIIKACEFFRQNDQITFFPDTAVLQRYIRDLDFSLRHLADRYGIEKQPEILDVESRDPQGCKKIAEILHDANLPHDATFCQKCNSSI